MPFADQMLTGLNNFNTGIPSQYLVPKEIHKVILIPKGRQFTSAEVQTMYATLLAGCNQSTQSSRMYPLGPFTGFEDKSSGIQLNNTQYGTVTYGRDGKYHLEFSYVKGGIQLHNKLRNMFNDQQDAYDILLLEKSVNTVMGTKPVLGTTLYYLQGYSLDQIYVEQMSFANGTDEAKFKIGFVFTDTDELNERFASVAVDPSTYNLMSLVGLKDLEFQLYSQVAAGVGKARVTTGWGAVDLYDLYASALVALTANWTFKDASNNTLTCTVALDAATKTLSFTFSGANYTAMASGAVIYAYTPTVAQMTATIPGYANGQFAFFLKP